MMDIPPPPQKGLTTWFQCPPQSRDHILDTHFGPVFTAIGSSLQSNCCDLWHYLQHLWHYIQHLPLSLGSSSHNESWFQVRTMDCSLKTVDSSNGCGDLLHEHCKNRVVKLGQSCDYRLSNHHNL